MAPRPPRRRDGGPGAHKGQAIEQVVADEAGDAGVVGLRAGRQAKRGVRFERLQHARRVAHLAARGDHAVQHRRAHLLALHPSRPPRAPLRQRARAAPLASGPKGVVSRTAHLCQ